MPIKKITKEEIIEKAYHLFRTQGYHKTSMAHVAKACGMFKSGLYHYFANKEDVMKAVLHYVHGLSKNGLFAVLRNSDLKPRKRVNRFMDILKVVHLKEKGGCLLGNIILETSCHNESFRHIISDYFDDYEDALGSLFQTRYSKKESKQLAVQWLQELEGAIMFSRIYNNVSYIKDVHQKLYSYIKK